ncbi:hypothetical protein Hamer_G012321 [Homarus americanus]|uniref:Uncharacterized protein n=1 Tax=Homarus americanus TaxID=6706 RepID=A0A8J5N049_HOMAM|nr:hypothetical protein Hamer_G012321 [Homarus americanus]
MVAEVEVRCCVALYPQQVLPGRGQCVCHVPRDTTAHSRLVHNTNLTLPPSFTTSSATCVTPPLPSPSSTQHTKPRPRTPTQDIFTVPQC